MRRLLISLTIIGLELIFAGQVSANAKIHESLVEYSSGVKWGHMSPFLPNI